MDSDQCIELSTLAQVANMRREEGGPEQEAELVKLGWDLGT